MSSPGRLKGKRAVIAGVGPGMGSAIAMRFADEGAKVVLGARTLKKLKQLVATIEERGGEAHGVACDLADGKAVKALLKTAVTKLGGPPDILVNSVGTWLGGTADEYDAKVVDGMLNANLRTIMTTTPIFATAMKKAGHGAIVNIAASFGVNFASKGQAVYNATKAGVAGYSESAAADLLASGIRVNYVMPGGTDHDFEPDRNVAKLRHLGKSRSGKPEDVANAILFLASDEASWVTGAGITVDGGEALRR